jgi:hypothetical protein
LPGAARMRLRNPPPAHRFNRLFEDAEFRESHTANLGDCRLIQLLQNGCAVLLMGLLRSEERFQQSGRFGKVVPARLQTGHDRALFRNMLVTLCNGRGSLRRVLLMHFVFIRWRRHRLCVLCATWPCVPDVRASPRDKFANVAGRTDAGSPAQFRPALRKKPQGPPMVGWILVLPTRQCHPFPIGIQGCAV